MSEELEQVEVGQIIEASVRIGRVVRRRRCIVDGSGEFEVSSDEGSRVWRYANGRFETRAGAWSKHGRVLIRPWTLAREVGNG